MKHFALLFALGGGLAIACGGGGSSPTGTKAGSVVSTIAAGTWGGEHVSILVSDAGAAVQFDCAHGSIPAPLAVGADGRFVLAGVFVKEHGGPIKIGESEDSQPASYSGQIQGRTMTLSIALTRDQQTVGPYTLAFDNPGHIVRCL